MKRRLSRISRRYMIIQDRECCSLANPVEGMSVKPGQVCCISLLLVAQG